MAVPLLRWERIIGRGAVAYRTFSSTNWPRKASMTSAVDLKHAVCAAVDAMRAELIGISRAIHAEPELAFEEEKAAARLTWLVEQHDLPVVRGAYGLKTAFASEFGPQG